MERSNRSKLNTQIYEEACEWFIECRGGDIDGANRRDFDEWLRKSPEHLRAYLEIAAIWNEGPALDPAGKWDMDTLITEAQGEPDNIVTHPSAKDKGIGARARVTTSSASALPSTHPLDPEPAPSPFNVPRSAFGRRSLFAIAASVMIAGLGTWLYDQRNIYSTDIGEQRSIRLTDGSTVDLNSRSRIEVRYSAGERSIDLLEGQALFQVAKNAERPFVVVSHDTRVRAVGTQFDVNRRSTGTVVTVLEGRVAVDARAASLKLSSQSSERAPPSSKPLLPGEGAPSEVLKPSSSEVFLSAGEQIKVARDGALHATAANLSTATAWKQRQLVFESATLSEVAEEFNRYNERRLIVEDANLYDFHISGIFSSSDPTSLIHFLRTRPGVEVVETADEIRVVKNF